MHMKVKKNIVIPQIQRLIIISAETRGNTILGLFIKFEVFIKCSIALHHYRCDIMVCIL